MGVAIRDQAGLRVPSGTRDARYLLVAPSGVSALVSSWGAGIVAIQMPDRAGRFADVVLGFDTAAGYVAKPQLYFGSTVGRVANRIRGATFLLDGALVSLGANDGFNHLHGGAARSFDRVEWEAATARSADGASVIFNRVSPELEEGYPGQVSVTVTYTLTVLNELRIGYEAVTDHTTPLSLTNHTYWNLAGAGAPSVLGHELWVAADRYTPTDDELIPIGTIESVDRTPLDFRTPRLIGERIAALEATGAQGYDHNLVLPDGGSASAAVARMRDPVSGRVVEVLTTQPCLQVYSGNLMTPVTGKFGAHYARRSGICLEPQGYPDAVHHPAFRSVLLEPGDRYLHEITFRLTTDREGGEAVVAE